MEKSKKAVDKSRYQSYSIETGTLRNRLKQTPYIRKPTRFWKWKRAGE